MNANNRRLIISIVAGIVVLAGGIALSQYFQQQAAPPPKEPSYSKRPEVDTMHANNTTISTSIEVQGQLVAFDKIDIFSEVAGTLERTKRPFKVGSYFPKGSTLIRVNQTEARLSLLSQKSNLLNAITQVMPDLKIDYPESFEQWNTYLEAFDVEQAVPELPDPLNRQEKYFIASRNIYSQYYTIKSAEERLDKYEITAPFRGVITESSINQGALVRAGQKLGELMNAAVYELEATVPLRELKYIDRGSRVLLGSDDIEGEWTGRVKRINDQVDPGTQTVTVFINVSGPDLREGMYLRGSLKGSDIRDALRLPRNLLVDQQRVYTVRDTLLDLRDVDVIKITRDAAVVRGIEDGTPLLGKMIPNAFDGMPVKIRKEQANTDSNRTATPQSASSSLR